MEEADLSSWSMRHTSRTISSSLDYAGQIFVSLAFGPEMSTIDGLTDGSLMPCNWTIDLTKSKLPATVVGSPYIA